MEYKALSVYRVFLDMKTESVFKLVDALLCKPSERNLQGGNPQKRVKMGAQNTQLWARFLWVNIVKKILEISCELCALSSFQKCRNQTLLKKLIVRFKLREPCLLNHF